MVGNDLPIIAKSTIIKGLQSLGVRPGQVIMLHVSVKAIGWIVGGPDVVLDAFLETLTPEGTLMMYVRWEDIPYHLKEWPPNRQQAYLEECPAFDPITSRSYRKFSILTEYIRTRKGAYRSNNPEWSVVAIGEKAEWLTKDSPLNYGCGPGSPFEKLVELNGKVLLLGAPINSVSLLHYAEHLVNIPNKRFVQYQVPMMLDDKREWIEIEELDSSNGIIDWPTDYFEGIVENYIASGKGQTGLVGNAKSFLFDANDIVSFAVDWMEREFTKIVNP